MKKWLKQNHGSLFIAGLGALFMGGPTTMIAPVAGVLTSLLGLILLILANIGITIRSN
jgi:hypothetical protein